MKTKLVMFLGIICLVLALSGPTYALELEEGPLLFKTYNWEVGATYLGGTSGMTYFRTTTSFYHKSDGTLVSYTGAADQGLFSDLTIIKDPSLNDGEDTWGLLEVRQLELGDVLLGGNVGDPIGPRTPAEIYWNSGDNGVWIRGVMWGLQDQAIEWIADDFVRIYSDNMQFNLYEMNTTTYNPQAGGNPMPANRDKTNPGEFAPAGWDPWIADTGNNLLLAGSSSWFRFSGDLDDPDGSNIPAGESGVYLDIDPTAGQWGVYFQNWWGDPAGGERSDVWQSWNIGKPVPYENGWIGSEDSGRAFIVEPQDECLLEVVKEGCVDIPSTECVTELPAGSGAYDVIYIYDVTNISAVSTVMNVSVIDDMLGEVPGSPIGSISPGETVTLTAVVSLSEETTNMVTVTGYVGGLECQASDTVTITKKSDLGCRMTGGGNDTFDECADANDDCKYTFGGQAGSPTGCQPQPWGEWTHSHHSGMEASFTFHAGTASAPEGTEIDWIACSDPDWCVQARPAPNKQIDFGGVGTFKNIRLKNGSPLGWMEKNKLYQFDVHVEDLGEPGNTNTKKNPLLGTAACPAEGRNGLGGELANCGCPDFYRITIYNPDGPEYYEVYGYINGGNLQIHPPHDCK